MIPWTTITRLGDLMIMAPAALAILLWLGMANERRLALWWAVLLGAATLLTAATKIAFIGWGAGIPALDFTGFSGHTMRATAILPVLCYLALQKAPSSVRTAGVLFGFAGAAAIGISRLVLRSHSVSEVLLGALLGTIVSIVFIGLCSELRAQVLNRTRITLSMAALFAASCAGPAPTHQWLTDATLYFTGHDKPFSRTGWRLERSFTRPSGLL
jgi:membrane-associated phospholipid phosphatase